MLQAIGVIIFLVLGYTVLALFAQHLPPSWAAGVPFPLPLIGIGAAAWLFAPSRKGEE